MTKKKLPLIIIAVVVILVGIYSFIALSYNNKFFPKTTLNDIDISGLTLLKAEEKMIDETTKSTLSISDDGTEVVIINKEDFGLTTDYSEYLQSMLNKQNNWLWIVGILQNHQETTDSSLDEDIANEKLEELTKQLEELNSTKTPSTNAQLNFSDGAFSITEETIGTEFDVEAVIKEVQTDLVSNESTLELNDFLKEPTVKKDDPELAEALADAEKISNVTATYQILGETFTVPQESIAEWIEFSDGEITLNSDEVRSYVEELGNKYNTSTNSTEFNSTKQGTVTVPAGSYSWTIQTDSETEGLIADILTGEDFTRSPIVQGSTTDSGSSLIQSTYIEVDLSAQHMWYYENGELKLETDIVSGKPSTPTPAGVFYVWNKERNATLKGEDYSTPVSYWMPIDWTGVGIHDSSWQSSYGGSRYTTNGSHGCINTPPSVVAELYNMVEIGTPVIVIN